MAASNADTAAAASTADTAAVQPILFGSISKDILDFVDAGLAADERSGEINLRYHIEGKLEKNLAKGYVQEGGRKRDCSFLLLGDENVAKTLHELLCTIDHMTVVKSYFSIKGLVILEKIECSLSSYLNHHSFMLDCKVAQFDRKIIPPFYLSIIRDLVETFTVLDSANIGVGNFDWSKVFLKKYMGGNLKPKLGLVGRNSSGATNLFELGTFLEGYGIHNQFLYNRDELTHFIKALKFIASPNCSVGKLIYHPSLLTPSQRLNLIRISYYYLERSNKFAHFNKNTLNQIPCYFHYGSQLPGDWRTAVFQWQEEFNRVYKHNQQGYGFRPHDLLRFMKNVLSHLDEKENEMNKTIKFTDTEIDGHFSYMFPRMLLILYNYFDEEDFRKMKV